MPRKRTIRKKPPAGDDAFRRFLQHVWQEDIPPLLADRRRPQRRKTARAAGTAAAATGLVVDSLLRLRGKPFTRMFTTIGTRLGALLPDAWDWDFLRENTSPRQRAKVRQRIRQRARQLPEADALRLFRLTPAASRAQLRDAWRDAARRWHPDHAPDDERRYEYQLRFVTYKAAYERLRDAHDAGRLPLQRRKPD